MRTGEGFVNVVMHHVPSEITRSRDPHDGIHVCTVDIDQPPRVMDNFGCGCDLSFKQTKRVWVGHHENGSLFINVPLQFFKIDKPAFSWIFTWR